jgi:TrbC/VIRB2 pilin
MRTPRRNPKTGDARHATRKTVRVCVVLGLLTGAALAVLFSDAHVHALNAAGAFNGTPISGVQNFIDKLKGNLVWLGGTAMGLVIAVVGIMFMAGHSRAHDLAIRTLAGLAILASISGIVA